MSHIKLTFSIGATVLTLVACGATNVPMAEPGQDIGASPMTVSKAQQVFADICLNSGTSFQAFREKAISNGLVKFETTDTIDDGHRSHDFWGSTTYDLSTMKHDTDVCSVVYGLTNRAPDTTTSEASFANVNPNNFYITVDPSDGTGLNALFAAK